LFRPAGLPLSYAIENVDPAKALGADGPVRIIADATVLRPTPVLKLIEASPATAQ
jgi:hypothetical protein